METAWRGVNPVKSLVAARDAHGAGAGRRVPLAMRHRVALCRFQRHPIGAAPGDMPAFFLVAERQRAAALRFDRMHAAPGTGAVLQRLLVGLRQVGLVKAGAKFAGVPVVGDRTVTGSGGRGGGADKREQGNGRGCALAAKTMTILSPRGGFKLLGERHSYPPVAFIDCPVFAWTLSEKPDIGYRPLKRGRQAMRNLRATIAVAGLAVLCGCATAAQRQFETMKAGNQQANAEMKGCLTAAYNSPEADPIRIHLPLNFTDATLQQLGDASYATSTEIRALLTQHERIQSCRKSFLESRSQSEPVLVPILVNAYNKGDDDVLYLTHPKISWGEFLRRSRDRSVETQLALQAADKTVISDLRREDRAERAERQRAAEAFAAWAQTQQLINAANKPVITNCSGFGNTVNCVSR